MNRSRLPHLPQFIVILLAAAASLRLSQGRIATDNFNSHLEDSMRSLLDFPDDHASGAEYSNSGAQNSMTPKASHKSYYLNKSKIRSHRAKATPSNNVASKYMRHLFEQYQNSEFKPKKGNMVRSILPKIGYIDGQQLLIFNLSGIKARERVLQAEVHYQLKAPHHHYKHNYYKSKPTPVAAAKNVIAVGIDPANTQQRVELQPIRSHEGAAQRWISFDVSRLVQGLTVKRQSRRAAVPPSVPPLANRYFGVKFGHLRGAAWQRAPRWNRRPAKLARRHSPFLLVYSDDSKSANSDSLEEMESHLYGESDGRLPVLPSGPEVDSTVMPTASKRKSSDQDNNFDVEFNTIASGGKRRKRSIEEASNNAGYYSYSVNDNTSAQPTAPTTAVSDFSNAEFPFFEEELSLEGYSEPSDTSEATTTTPSQTVNLTRHSPDSILLSREEMRARRLKYKDNLRNKDIRNSDNRTINNTKNDNKNRNRDGKYSRRRYHRRRNGALRVLTRRQRRKFGASRRKSSDESLPSKWYNNPREHIYRKTRVPSVEDGLPRAPLLPPANSSFFETPDAPFVESLAIKTVPAGGSNGEHTDTYTRVVLLKPGAPQQRNPEPNREHSSFEQHFSSNKYHRSNNLNIDESTAPFCKKKRLRVNFADIGWNDWIIAPDSVDANYCLGSCHSKPGKSNLRQTNHAILQNIARALGNDPSFPPPCCAPDKMDSLTLLYFDEAGNVVLKNYPKMIVKSCACL